MVSSPRSRHARAAGLAARHGRAAGLAGMTAGVLLLTAALAPSALAGPVTTVHTFDDAADTEGWVSYGGGITSSVTRGRALRGRARPLGQPVGRRPPARRGRVRRRNHVHRLVRRAREPRGDGPDAGRRRLPGRLRTVGGPHGLVDPAARRVHLHAGRLGRRPRATCPSSSATRVRPSTSASTTSASCPRAAAPLRTPGGGSPTATRGGSITSGVIAGEVCGVVAAHTGSAWDVALQQDDVEYVDGTTYTVEFDAHASRAVTVPLQGGGTYPDVFPAYAVALDGSTTPQHVEFDFTPRAGRRPRAPWPSSSATRVRHSTSASTTSASSSRRRAAAVARPRWWPTATSPPATSVRGGPTASPGHRGSTAVRSAWTSRAAPRTRGT